MTGTRWVLAVAALSAACGGTSKPAVISAHGAWTRAADSGTVTSVYVTVVNGAAQATALTGASSPWAASVTPHETMQMSGMVHMMPLADSIPIASGDSLVFGEGAKHLMVNGLTRRLATGDSLPVTLTFNGGRTVEVRAAVKTP